MRKAHAAALVADGGDRSVVTGANLLEALKAGCGGLAAHLLTSNQFVANGRRIR